MHFFENVFIAFAVSLSFKQVLCSMSSAELVEKVERIIGNMERTVRMFKSNLSRPERVERLRKEIQKLDMEYQKAQMSAPSSDTDRQWGHLRTHYRNVKQEADDADKAAREKEKLFPKKGASNQQEGSRMNDGTTQPRVFTFQRVDMNELETESMLQEEKLKHALDIESSMQEVHDLTREAAFLSSQQDVVDRMEYLVDQSTKNVNAGKSQDVLLKARGCTPKGNPANVCRECGKTVGFLQKVSSRRCKGCQLLFCSKCKEGFLWSAKGLCSECMSNEAKTTSESFSASASGAKTSSTLPSAASASATSSPQPSKHKDPTSATVPPSSSSSPDTAGGNHCDGCGNKFGLFSKKLQCAKCKITKLCQACSEKMRTAYATTLDAVSKTDHGGKGPSSNETWCAQCCSAEKERQEVEATRREEVKREAERKLREEQLKQQELEKQRLEEELQQRVEKSFLVFQNHIKAVEKRQPQWPDGSNCSECEAGFSFMVRKHHCRWCMSLLCDPCCKKRVVNQFNSSSSISDGGGKKNILQVRMCAQCFDNIERLVLTENEEEDEEDVGYNDNEESGAAASSDGTIAWAKGDDASVVRKACSALATLSAIAPLPFKPLFIAAKKLCDCAVNAAANRVECHRLASRVVRIQAAVVKLSEKAGASSENIASTLIVEDLKTCIDDGVKLLQKFQQVDEDASSGWLAKAKKKVKWWSDCSSKFKSIHDRLSTAIQDMGLVQMVDRSAVASPQLADIESSIRDEVGHVLDAVQHSHDELSSQMGAMRESLLKELQALTAVQQQQTTSSTNSTSTTAQKRSIIVDPASVSVNRKCRLGSGGFGDVYAGDYFGTPVAVKEVRVTGKEMRKIVEREVEFLQQFRHRNVVALYGMMCTTAMPCAIVMEKLKWTLSELIHGSRSIEKNFKLSNAERFSYTTDLIAAMHHLHGGGGGSNSGNSSSVSNFSSRNRLVLHDLKPSNIMVTEDRRVAKLIDFGTAESRQTIEKLTKSKICGTVAFMAPELLLGKGGSGNASSTAMSYGPEVDVYSFAITLFELWSGLEPWEGLPNDRIIAGVTSGRRPGVSTSEVTSVLQELVTQHKIPYIIATVIVRCWDQSPENRPLFSSLLFLREKGSSLLDVTTGSSFAASGIAGVWSPLSPLLGSSNLTTMAAENTIAGAATGGHSNNGSSSTTSSLVVVNSPASTTTLSSSSASSTVVVAAAAATVRGYCSQSLETYLSGQHVHPDILSFVKKHLIDGCIFVDQFEDFYGELTSSNVGNFSNKLHLAKLRKIHQGLV